MVGRRTFVAAVAAASALLAGAWPALAGSQAAPAGATGHDASYPQCSGGGGTTVGSLGGQFGLVGVTDGLPWSVNPCLSSEYAWAAGRPDQPGLYVNAANPAPRSSYFWPTSGSSAPALCINSTSTTDPGCAYDYGWHAAANALSTAEGVAPAATLPWWLDVESANSWNGNGTANAADLQGFVDYLRSSGAPAVGIYSSAGDWSTITGGYSVGTAATYQSAWAPEFAPRYPLYQSPTWVAGAGSSATAASTCGAPAFTGVVPQLAQYYDGSGYDADLVCGSSSTPLVSVALSPGSGRVKPGGSLSSTVTVAEQGTAQAVTLQATSSPAGPVLTLNPGSLPGPGNATLTIATPHSLGAGTYTVVVTATGASASGSAVFTLKVR